MKYSKEEKLQRQRRNEWYQQYKGQILNPEDFSEYCRIKLPDDKTLVRNWKPGPEGKWYPRGYFAERVFVPALHSFRLKTAEERTQERIQEKIREAKRHPLDVFRKDEPVTKLYRLLKLKDDDNGSLLLAVNAVVFYFYGSKDEDNPFRRNNLYRQRHVDTYSEADILDYDVGCFLFDSERWARLIEKTPLHQIYREFVKPLRELINEIYAQFEKKQAVNY